MVYISKLGSRIKIASEALSIIQEHASCGNEVEAGGVLIGRFLKNSLDVVIDHVTCPQQRDRREPFLFYKNAPEHQLIIDAYWVKSSGTENYLGEWHTHCEVFPLPSRRDVLSWRKMLRSTISSYERLFFIIAGTGVTRAWEGHKNSLVIAELRRCDYGKGDH